jgi:hypothetical protein
LKWRTLSKEAVEDFTIHIGPFPGRGYSVDRIENSRGYEPGNVRWATKQEQSDNRRQPLCKEKISDADIAFEYHRRGLGNNRASVFRAVPTSENTPSVGNVIFSGV